MSGRLDLERFEVELSRPYFSFERGRVETRAYWWEDRFAFVHHLLSGDGVHAHGVVVEHF